MRVMVLRFFSLLFFTLVFVGSAFASDIGMTQKDKLAFRMSFCFTLLERMDSAERLFGKSGIKIDNSEFISKIKSKITKELKELQWSYSNNNKEGVYYQDLWQIYNQCSDFFDGHTQKLASHKAKASRKSLGFLKNMSARPAEKSLLGLAKDFVTAYAAIPYDADLKLFVLNRDNKTTKLLKNIFEESFTLYIPMGRALERVKDECAKNNVHINSTTSFMGYLIEELQQNYWRDESFVVAMRYLKEYFEYEYRLAKAQWSKTYSLLKHSDADNLSRQFLASFIFLNVMSGFLATHGGLRAALKDFAKADELKFNYHSDKPLLFSATSPLWSKFVDLILKDPDNQLRTRSLSGRVVRYPQPKKAVVVDKVAAFSQTKPIKLVDTVEAIIAAYATSENDPGLVSTTQINPIFNQIVKMNDDGNFRMLVDEFAMLQKIIREKESYYVTDPKSIVGNLYADKLDKLASADTWSDLVVSFKEISKIANAEKSDQLYFLSEQVAHVLLQNMYFLDEKDLLDLLQAFAEAGMSEYWNRIYKFLKRNKIISDGSYDLDKSLKFVNFDLTNSSSMADRPPSFSTEPIFFHYNHRNIKINFPKKGIRQVVSALKRTVFEGVDLELLAMVARLAAQKELKVDEVYYQKNDKSDSFALIVEGGLEVYDDNAVLGKLSKENLVGFMSIFDVKPKRSASVRAKVATKIYEFPIAGFKQIMKGHPALMRALVKQLAQTVSNQQQKLCELGVGANGETQVNLINSVDPGDMLILGKNAQIGSVEKDDVLVKPGQLAHSLFYITKGSLVREDGTEIKKKSYFDEISFLAGSKHSMKVTGGERGCQYLFFDIDKFMDLSNDSPNFLRPMARQLNMMIKDNNAILGQTDAFRLQIALEKGELDGVKEILEKVEINVNASCPQNNGMTKGTRPIHIAARNNSPEILQYLLDHGADMALSDNLGNTAAHIAAKRDYLAILQILKKRGADFNVFNSAGKMPYDLAKEKNHESIANWFEKLSREPSLSE